MTSAEVPDDVFVVTTYGATGDGAIDDTAAVQASIDAAELAGGGTVYFPPGTYRTTAALAVTGPGIRLVGAGAPGTGGTLGDGASRIIVAPGDWGLVFAEASASHQHSGPRIENLHLEAADATSLGGIWLDNASNGRIVDVTAYGFTGGTGFRFGTSGGTTSASQYHEMHGCTAIMCQVGVDVLDSNGLRMFGGFVQHYEGGDAAVVPGTIGVRVASGADSFRASSVVTQMLETCYDVSGEYAYIEAGRFEGFTTGVKFKGTGGTFGPGGQFSNSILGLGATGQCVSIEATAARTTVHPFAFVSVTPVPVSDSGTLTHRLDGVPVDLAFAATVSATGDVILPALPSHLSRNQWKVRYAELRIGGTAVAASASDYWTATLRVRGSSNIDLKAVDSQAGWSAYAAVAIDPTSGTDVTLNAGDRLHLSLTKTGAPANLTGASLHMVLVPR